MRVFTFKKGSVFGRLLKTLRNNTLKNVPDYEKKDEDFLYAECCLNKQRIPFKRIISPENIRRFYPKGSNSPYGKTRLDDNPIHFYSILGNVKASFFFGPAKNEVTFKEAYLFPDCIAIPLEKGMFPDDIIETVNNFIKVCSEKKKKIFSVRKRSVTMKIHKNSLAEISRKEIKTKNVPFEFCLNGKNYWITNYKSDNANALVYSKDKCIYLKFKEKHLTCVSLTYNSYERSQQQEIRYRDTYSDMEKFLGAFVKP